MLVSALLLLFGGRADATRVRTGAGQASVDGRLLLGADSPAVARVEDAGGAVDEDGSLLLRRVVSAAGRSRAFVGGAPAPVSVLGRAGRAPGRRARSGRSAAADPPGPAPARPGSLRRHRHERTTRPRSTAWRAAARAAGRSQRPGPRTAARGRDAQPRARRDRRRRARSPARTSSWPPRPAGSRTSTRCGSPPQLAHDAVLGDPDDPAGDDRRRRRPARHGPARARPGRRRRPRARRARRRGWTSSSPRPPISAPTSPPTAITSTPIPQRLEQIEARRAVLAGLLRRYGEDIDAVLEWAESARRAPRRARRLRRCARPAGRRARSAGRPRPPSWPASCRRSAAAAAARLADGDHRRTGRARRCRSARVLIEVRRAPVQAGGADADDRRAAGRRRRQRGRRGRDAAADRIPTRRRCRWGAARPAASCRG